VEHSFTVTATGFAGTVSGTARAIQIGKQVTLHLPDLTGTSNGTGFTVTGLLAGLAGAGVARIPSAVQDSSGTLQTGLLALVGLDITVFATVALAGWTASGTKSLFAPPFTYLLP
jgi:hypothetical protein